MSVSTSDIITCLRAFNPWWETGEVPTAWASRFERDALPGVERTYAERDAGRGVVLIGPRRVGKTTIAYQVIRGLLRAGAKPADICFIVCDDPRLKGAPLIDIIHAYESLHGARSVDDGRVRHLFFDEVQHAADWPLWLKQIADRRLPYRFLATGSSATALRTGGSSAGIGRWREQLLLPLSFREFVHLHPGKSRAFPRHDRLLERLRRDPERLFADDLGAWVDRELGEAGRQEVDRLQASLSEYLLFGGFPEVASIDSLDEARRRIVNDVVLRTLASDVALAHGVLDPNAIERLFLRLCASSGGLWSDSEAAKELGLSRPTVAKYTRFLEDASLALRFDNLAKAQRGMPKLYVVDPAVRAAMLVVGRESVLRPETYGPLLENAIVAALFGAREQKTSVGFWRRDRSEVDAVLARWSRRGLLIEVKSTLRGKRVQSSFAAAAEDLRAYRGTYSHVALHMKARGGHTTTAGAAPLQELHPATFLYTFSSPE